MSCVALTRQEPREITRRGVTQTVDEFRTGGPSSLRLIVRFDHASGTITACVICGTARTFRILAVDFDASPDVVAKMLGDITAGLYGTARRLAAVH